MYISVVYKGSMYIFGGYNGLHNLHFRDFFRFDPGMYIIYSEVTMVYIIFTSGISSDLTQVCNMFGGYNGLLYKNYVPA